MRRPSAECRPGRPAALPLVLATAAAMVAAAPAQAQQPRPSLAFTPYASVSETLTDNFDLVASGKSADAITRLTAGLSMRSQSGRIQGYADYNVSALLYASHGSRNELQHRLAADVDIEWFEKQGFLRAGASITQVAQSAFGAPVRADGLPGSNSTELRTLRVAPRWQGLLAGVLRVDAQAEAQRSDAADSTLGDTSSGSASVRVAPRDTAPLSWAAEAAQQESNYDRTRSARSTRAFGSVFWLIDSLDLRLSAQGGRERANYTSIDARDTSTWGAGLEWTPSPRTRLVAQTEERSFGRSHLLSLLYRTPRTVWQLTDSRGINTGAASLVPIPGNDPISVLFNSPEFVAAEPDFARRAELIRAYLLRFGPNFLRSGATIDDRQDFSVTWRAPRTTATMSLGRSDSRRADPLVTGRDDFDLTDRVRQSNWGLLITHRLMPQMNAGLTLTHQQSTGGIAALRSSQRGVSLQLSGSLSPQDGWSLALRHNRYETNLVPYTESSVVATYDIRF